VNARTKHVLAEALELPKEERATLAQELLASLDGEDSDAAAAWTEVIRRRAEDALEGRACGPECRPFLADLRERLRRGE
jgi:Putative addiction module component